ncbi:SNARE associated Golgi protein [Trinorchestia longiramus]|nr:SNARE associated Golgi protein [Trinorchestia longiramus]
MGKSRNRKNRQKTQPSSEAGGQSERGAGANNALLGAHSRSPGPKPAGSHVVSMSADSALPQKRLVYRHTPNGAGNSKTSGSVNGGGGDGMSTSLRDKLKEKNERQTLVLWRRPLTTLHYFILETWHLLRHYVSRVWHHKMAVGATLAVLLLYYAIKATPGPHQQMLDRVSTYWVWCGWWVWLGVLSSVGLGTGLHTFLLYLGPHIASVTMAAYTCNSLNFPEPPYPDEIVCPDASDTTATTLSIWTIMSKVRLEAFMWGAGTALGELPPYFMARGARLSGYDPDDEEMAEFEELQRLKERPEDMGWIDRAKLSIEKLVERVGFFGILACASIPNPLFDLAGITCGHFLVPFWTFFGATLIGKAIIKMHIQKLFVIIAFNEALLTSALELLASVPVLGPTLQKPFKKFLTSQQSKLKRTPGTAGAEAKDGVNFLSWAFDKFILLMVAYFVVSIINSLAQSCHKRLSKSSIRRRTASETLPQTPRPTKSKHAKD